MVTEQHCQMPLLCFLQGYWPSNSVPVLLWQDLLNHPAAIRICLNLVTSVVSMPPHKFPLLIPQGRTSVCCCAAHVSTGSHTMQAAPCLAERIVHVASLVLQEGFFFGLASVVFISHHSGFQLLPVKFQMTSSWLRNKREISEPSQLVLCWYLLGNINKTL